MQPAQTLQPLPTRRYWIQSFRDNGVYSVIVLLLIAFPFIVGLLTGDSPYGVLRGDRYLQRGQAVYWESLLIEVFILAVLAMSYNLLFGFTGVISFGHALFFGMGGYMM